MENLPIDDETASLFESDNENSAEENKEDPAKKFRQELRKMIYGFGDVKNPQEKTVELLYTMVIEYITAVAKFGQSLDPRKKLTLQAIHYITQNDPPKFQRIQELLIAQQELKKARKHFENPI